MSKKGLSDIVSTVLIILLVVAAIAIIGLIIMSLLNRFQNDAERGALCSSLNIVPTSCKVYDDSSRPVVVFDAGSSNASINGFDLLFYNGSSVEKRHVNISSTGVISFNFSRDNIDDLTRVPGQFSVIPYVSGSRKNFSCSESEKISCTDSFGGHNLPPVLIVPDTPSISQIVLNIAPNMQNIGLTWNAVGGGDKV